MNRKMLFFHLFTYYTSICIINAQDACQERPLQQPTVINNNYGTCDGPHVSSTGDGSLSSIVGPPGKRGPTGITGEKGQHGQKGDVGEKGDQGTCDCGAVLKKLDDIQQILQTNECASNPCSNGGTCIDNYDSYFCHCLPDHHGKHCENENGLLSCDEAGATVVGVPGGIFLIKPISNLPPFSVYCDFETDGGNWMIIQRRIDGSEDFYRDWDNYMQGFGMKDSEYWIGLEKMHLLTQSGEYELRVDLVDWDGKRAYAHYTNFVVGPSSDNYRLTVGGYSGTAGDSMDYHNNMQFTTKEADNDPNGGNCAVTVSSAWWYKGCFHADLNGYYHGENAPKWRGVYWYHWRGDTYSCKRAEMKIRKK